MCESDSEFSKEELMKLLHEDETILQDADIELDSTCVPDEQSVLIQCGEIVLHSDNLFNIKFRCIYCKSDFESLQVFLRHNYEDHLGVAKDMVDDFLETCEKPPDIKISLDEIEIANEVKTEILSTDEKPNKEEIYDYGYNDCMEEKTKFMEKLENFVKNADINVIIEDPNKENYEEDRDAASDNEKTYVKFDTRSIVKRKFFSVYKHLRSRSFKCTKCSKIYSLQKNLERHMKIHESTSLFTCEYCGVNFNDSGNFKVHIKRHLGIKDHKCTICGKGFVSTTEKTLHERTHTGERPYECEECGRKFLCGAALVSHKRRHTNERPYPCPDCGKRFMDRKHLIEHKMLHTSLRPYECQICSAAFRRRTALNEHMKLHSEVKQYNCKICSKAFAQHAGLYSHMKTHNKDIKKETL